MNRALLAPSVAALALAAPLLTGCVDVLGGRAAPETRFYSLDPRLPGEPAAEPLPSSLLVERVAIDPTVRRQEILLRKKEPSQEVVPFLYHRWISMPDVFVGERLREHLFASGLFSRVIAGGERREGDYRLACRLTRLEGVESESGIEGVVVLEATLAQSASGESPERILFHHRIEKRAPAASASPGAIADALAAALEALFDDIARRIDFTIRDGRS